MTLSETQMHSASHRTKTINVRALSWAGPLTIVVTIVVNLGIRALAVAFFGVPDRFPLLQPFRIVVSAGIFLTLAIVAFILVGRFSRRPARTYRLVALVALLVSYLNPIMALARMFPAPGMNVNIFWTMIVLHTITAIITVVMLTRLSLES